MSEPITHLKDLTPDPRNARKHNPRNVGMIETSLQTVGAARSIVIDEDGIILAGNATVEAAAAAGIERVQVVDADGETIVAVRRTGLTDEQKKKLALFDNRTAELADWDIDELLASVADGVDLSAMFRQDELDALLQAAHGQDEKATGEDKGAQTDRADQLKEQYGTKLGQVWQLGEHRLAVGDCTDSATVEAVMRGERARVVATSPPYSNQRDYKIGDFDWQALARGFSECMFSVLDSPGDALINLGLEYKDGTVNAYWDEWLRYCATNGHPMYGWYVWDKGSGFPGEWNGRLAPCHEWVFHFSNGRVSANKWVETTGESARRGVSGKRFRQKDGSMKELYSPDTIGQPYKVPDSVIRVNREMARGIHTEAHPAVFSVEFAEFMVRTWSNEGGVCYEPFCGSGTTIVACEKLNRKCRAIELSPAYAAVAIHRYFEMTGKEPRLIT